MSYIHEYNEFTSNSIDEEIKLLLQTSNGTKHIKYDDYYNYYVYPIFDTELDNLIADINNVKNKKVYNNSFVINAVNNGVPVDAILDAENEKIKFIKDEYSSNFTNTIEYYPAFTSNKLRKYDVDIVITTAQNEIDVYKFNFIMSNGIILEVKNINNVNTEVTFNYESFLGTISERSVIILNSLFSSTTLQQDIRLNINRSGSPETISFILDLDGIYATEFPYNVQTRCEVTDYL